MENHLPKVSVITVVRNGAKTIRETIESVQTQDYPNIEHIIIDGASTDDTLSIIEKYKEKLAVLISEPDRGIYDAMNKGIARATGDIIATLNADDYYAAPDAISSLVSLIEKTHASTGWADLQYREPFHSERILRHWKSSVYTPGKFRYGWMPPHPTFFVRREIYEQYGTFRLDMGTSADYELMLRFLERYHVSSCYLSKTLVVMRAGGVSNKNILNRLYALRNDYRAWKINSLSLNPLQILLKPLSKIVQYFS